MFFRLRILSAKENDSGFYTCRSGEISRNLTLTVKKSSKNAAENLKRSSKEKSADYEKAKNISPLMRSLSVDSTSTISGDNLQNIMMDMQPESDIQKVDDYTNSPSPHEKDDGKEMLMNLKNGTGIRGGKIEN